MPRRIGSVRLRRRRTRAVHQYDVMWILSLGKGWLPALHAYGLEEIHGCVLLLVILGSWARSVSAGSDSCWMLGTVPVLPDEVASFLNVL